MIFINEKHSDKLNEWYKGGCFHFQSSCIASGKQKSIFVTNYRIEEDDLPSIELVRVFSIGDDRVEISIDYSDVIDISLMGWDSVVRMMKRVARMV